MPTFRPLHSLEQEPYDLGY